MKIEYILIVIFVISISYFIFYKKDTFINKKLENFNGDDLNVHNDEYTLNTDNNHNDNIIE